MKVDQLISGLTTRSAYRRFLGTSRGPSVAYVSSLGDPGRTLAATVGIQRGALVGIASLHPLGKDVAEVALLVADQVQAEGIGTLLLEGLVEYARTTKLGRLTATVLTENTPMLTVFRDLGLAVSTGHPSAGVVDLAIDVTSSGWYDQRVAERSFVSSVAAYRRALRPRAILLIHDHGGRKAARRAQDRLRRDGFTGTLTVVDHHEAIPPDTDLALLCGASGSIENMVAACADGGVPAVLWPQAPFAPEAARARVAETCAAKAVILLGPGSRVRLHPGPTRATSGHDREEPMRDLETGIVVVGAHIGHLLDVVDRRGLDVLSALDLSWHDMSDWAAAVDAALLDEGCRGVVVCRPATDAGSWAAGVHEMGARPGAVVLTLAPDAAEGPQPDGTIGFRRASDAAAVLTLQQQVLTASPRPNVLVVGDENAAHKVRHACATCGILSARLTQQAERRLHLVTSSMKVDDNALFWEKTSIADLRPALETVVDCPEVDVVVVALDPPRSHADRLRCTRLEQEALSVCGDARIVACVSGHAADAPLPTFSGPRTCAGALAAISGTSQIRGSAVVMHGS